MNTFKTVEEVVDAALSGQEIEIPPMLHDDYNLAMAAHAALGQLFEDTLVADATHNKDRQPPALPEEYEIIREIGSGGMGVVYLVRQRSLGREIALKVLRPGGLAKQAHVRRFLEEAKHLASLRHSSIVPIHEIGDAAGEPYFTMDYVPGRSLSSLLRQERQSPSQAVAIIRQIANAVGYAHRNGIIHRDLKPGNVLLDNEGHVFVTDFGLARNVHQKSELTVSGELLGTPQYMSPEQARGESSLVGEATDIHALGMMLYEMLTGEPPYGSGSAAEILVRLLHEDPVALRTLDHRIPRDLETICLKMLQKSPADRYANVSAVLEDLRRYEAGEPLLARRPSIFSRIWRWSRAHRRTALTVLLTAMIVLLFAPRWFDRSHEELIRWGDEELTNGHAESAARVYLRSLKSATDEQRAALVDRIALTCAQLDDPKMAVELAMEVLDYAPNVSFGKYDYLVAQALMTRLRTKIPQGDLLGNMGVWLEVKPPDLLLTRARLLLAQESHLEFAQEEEVKTALLGIEQALSRHSRSLPASVPFRHLLPTGTAEQLSQKAEDQQLPLWDRGKAMFALGRSLESAGDRSEALTAYRRAYELIRVVYPMYSGVKASIGSLNSRIAAPDAAECLIVQDVVKSIQRLAPDSFPTPEGQIQFMVEGFELPAEMGLDLVIVLTDSAALSSDQHQDYGLPRQIPVQQGTWNTIGVLDGRYRLTVRGHSGRWESSVDRIARLIQVDVDGWPEEIEVRGEAVELSPVRLRLASEVRTMLPMDGEAVNLSRLELSWEALADVDHYQVQLGHISNAPHLTTTWFHSGQVSEPRLKFSDLEEFTRRQIRRELIAGRTAVWTVSAYDADGRRIGVTLDERRFLVAQELP